MADLSGKAVRWEKGADGIAVVTLDDPGKSANTMNDAYKAAMGSTVDELVAAREDLVGVIVTSAKKTFFAGGDLEALSAAQPSDAGAVMENVTEIKAQLRRLETLGKPVVAAMNGTALGAAGDRPRLPPRIGSTGPASSTGCPRSRWACCPAAVASPGSPACSGS